MIKSHFDRLDGHMREVVKGTALAFVLKIVGSGLAFAFNVAVARLLGAEGAGIYFLALSITAIGSVIGRIGLDNALLRFVATKASELDWAGVRGVYSLGIRLAIAAAGLVTAIVFFSAPWMADTLFNKPQLADPLRWMALSILPFSLLNLQAESLKGLKRIRDAMFVQGIGVPLVSLLLIVPLAKSFGVLGASLAYLAGSAVVAVLGMWAWHRAVAGHVIPSTPFPFKDLWASCRPLFMVSVINRAVLPWAPLFLLGIWATSEEVGVFGAALRVAMLVTFMLATINNVVAPKFAELYAKGDIETLGKIARHTTLLITILATPFFLVLIFGGELVMAMFGRGFEQGALVLAILAMGQFVNVFTGSVGYLLLMSENETPFQNLTIISASILLLMCLIFIPLWGAVGAALASSIAVAGLNIGSVCLVRRKIGIQSIPFLRG